MDIQLMPLSCHLLPAISLQRSFGMKICFHLFFKEYLRLVDFYKFVNKSRSSHQITFRRCKCSRSNSIHGQKCEFFYSLTYKFITFNRSPGSSEIRKDGKQFKLISVMCKMSFIWSILTKYAHSKCRMICSSTNHTHTFNVIFKWLYLRPNNDAKIVVIVWHQ